MGEVSVLKVRIKFTKHGPVKFVGHLDTMRYFQKAIRRAQLPCAFTGGFSPHIIMSFAAPLGVGTTSRGEYFDLELTEDMPTEEIVRRLDQQMVEGFSVIAAAEIEGGKSKNAMSLVAAADYLVSFREGKLPFIDWNKDFPVFLDQKEILITKTGKAGERQVDILPCIYKTELRFESGQQHPVIFMRLASASSNYTKPEQVIDAFLAFLDIEPVPYSTMAERLEVYADAGKEEHHFVPLGELGLGSDSA
ncbi:MAG: TIGR03936 family radical SAM-associated protein [Blautia sp.]|nr:TIGR03936 family radical SAM-associated protein [Blautia sp.]